MMLMRLDKLVKRFACWRSRSPNYEAIERSNTQVTNAEAEMHSPSMPIGYVKDYDEGRPRH